MEKFVCIGGMLIDLKAIYFHDLQEGDRTGRIRYRCGGVARNLAWHLATLEKPVYLVSAYGDDDFGKALKEHTIKSNINLDFSKEFHGAQTTTYVALFDSENRMLLNICDNELVSGLSEFDLRSALMNFDEKAYYLMDNNLSVSQIKVILKKEMQSYFVPIFAKEMKKYESLFSKFTLILFDAFHLEECCQMSVKNERDFMKASLVLLKVGVNSALMIVDNVGLAYMDQEALYICTCVAFSKVVTHNAHELLIASFLSVFVEHLPIQKALEYAMAAIILEQEIHNEAEHELTITKIIEKIQEIKPKVMKETYYVSEVH